MIEESTTRALSTLLVRLQAYLVQKDQQKPCNLDTYNTQILHGMTGNYFTNSSSPPSPSISRTIIDRDIKIFSGISCAFLEKHSFSSHDSQAAS